MSSSKDCSLELNPDELIKDRDGGKDQEIGRGDFNVVCSGTYHERKVAIKEPIKLSTPGEEDDEDFKRDVMLMEKVRHDAIVEFIGAVFAPNRRAIVTELCEYGTLDEAMIEHLEMFNEMMKLKCLLDVSSAMDYLHSDSIIHRGLKPQNILIVSLDPRENGVVAKVTDIGTVRSGERINCVMRTGTGYDPFMAPEILRHISSFDKSIDVYSFSMVMYYLFAEKLPTEDASLAKGGDPYERIISGKRPAIPSTCAKNTKRLMQQCWDGDPMKRPSFELIHALLKGQFLEIRYGREFVKPRLIAENLLNKMPELNTEEAVVWTSGGGKDFELLCELLKANAIPARRLETKGK